MDMLRTFRQKFWHYIWNRRGAGKNASVLTGREEHEKFNAVIAQDIAQKLQLNPKDRLLDIGCSGGYVLHDLAPKVESILAVDKFASMIARAKAILAEHHNIEFLCCDANNIPKPDHSYNKILCYSVLHYFIGDEYIEEFFQEIKRLLTHDGQALIGDIPDRLSTQFIKGNTWILKFKAWGGRSLSRWYTQDEMMRLADKHDLNGKILPQPESLPFASFRFDLLLTHKS